MRRPCGRRSTAGVVALRWKARTRCSSSTTAWAASCRSPRPTYRARPLSLASAGVVPVPSTLMVMAEGACLLRQTRRALYRHWQLADNAEGDPVRPLLARAGRLVAELTLGRGDAAHLRALDEVALELGAQGLAAAWPLVSSLRYYREQWERHARRESCPEGLCFEHQAAPCHGTCPANIDIPSFIAHIGHGDYRAAIEVIRRDNPLPLTCGLVCPAPCESACVRGGSNGAVFIRPMKAKAAEHCLADGGYPKPEIAPDSGKRIGIVGSGPAGLTAAYYLRTFGHEVEILEEQEKAGGMLRYGIPAYRLPPDLLDQELDEIRALGIAIRTSAEVPSLDAFRKNYDAVFLGLGTQRSRLIPIEGVHQSFVLGRHRLPAGRAQRRAGAGRAAGDRRRRRQRRDRRRPDGVAAGRNPRRHGLPGETPRDAGQPPRDRERRRGRRAAAPRLGPGPHRGGRRDHLPVLRAGPRRDREVRPEVRRRPPADARGRPRDPRHRSGHRPDDARRQRRREHPRLHPHRPQEPDDQGAGRLRRGRRRARPADGRGGHSLREDRRERDRCLAARGGHRRRHRNGGAPGRRASPAGHRE